MKMLLTIDNYVKGTEGLGVRVLGGREGGGEGGLASRSWTLHLELLIATRAKQTPTINPKPLDFRDSL